MRAFSRLHEYRYLLSALTRKEFKVRYSQSVLGMAWILLEPVINVITFSIVFTLMGRKGQYGAPFPLFFYSGLIIWNFFSSFISQGPKSFIKDKGLWTKLDFPRSLIVIKEALVYGTDMLLSAVPLAIIIAASGYSINVEYLLLVPIALATGLLGLGLMLLLASLNVYIRDIGIIMKTITSVWFWFSGVVFFFPFEGATKALFYVNPVAGAVLGFREIILLGRLESWGALLSLAIAGPVALALGYLVYSRMQRGFADVV
jgi:ABC-type polysaccharide/polyol phosphate export permease